MEVIRALNDLYKKAKEEIEYYEERSQWEKSDYNFESDPPCIKALLDNGIFQFGSINMTQFRLAAYLKIRNISMNKAIGILDEWLENVRPEFIEEYNKVTRLPDLTYLKGQNRYICTTVYSSEQYGFSCPGIKQIPGVADYCDDKCHEEITKDIEVSLFDATKAEYRHRRIGVTVDVIGRQDAVFIIPDAVKAMCTAARPSDDDCIDCKLFSVGDTEIAFEINAASPQVLRFLEPSNVPLMGKIGSLIGVPRKRCSRWKYNMTEQNAETIYIVPPIANEFSDSDRHTRQIAYFIGHGLKTNQKYRMSGYCHVAEKSNIVRLVFDKAEEAEDSLSEFKRTDEMVQASMIFSVGDITPLEKCREICESLTYNHIRIWGREAMIMAMDLVYHSVRRFYFQRKLIRGWMNALIIGDTGQGKTEGINAMMQHYNLGYKASAESSTRAGLLYGIDVKASGPNYLIWGAIPRYSGRMVVIDELKDLIQRGGFRQLTEARSSGKVVVDMIVSGRALAETRLVMLTNPPPKRRMGSYMYPVEAIEELIEDLEDTRRFDIVVGVASKEIDDEVIHQDITVMKQVEDGYISETCKNHLLWVWNLRPEDIIIDIMTERTILALSLRMCKEYSPVIPIVEPADQREKLARVAAAFAARVNSVNSLGQLVVTDAHVEAAFDFMTALYTGDALQYGEYSSVHAKLLLDSDTITDLEAMFKNDADWVLHWRDIAWYAAENGIIVPRIMSTVVGCETTVATKAMDWLVAYKLCRILSNYRYVKTENGTTFLRYLIKKELDKRSDKEKKPPKKGEELF